MSSQIDGGYRASAAEGKLSISRGMETSALDANWARSDTQPS